MRPDRKLIAVVGGLTSLDIAVWLLAVPLLPRWARESSLSATQSGLLLAAFSISVLALSVPAGQLGDRLGARRVTLAGATLFAATVPLLAFAHGFWQLFLLRIVQGACSSSSWSAGLAWLAQGLPADRRAAGLSVINAFGSAAGVLGPLLGGPAVGAFGIAPVMFGTSALILAAVVGGFRLPDPPAEGGRETESMRVVVGAGRRDPVLRSAFVSLFFVAGAMGIIQLLVPLALDGQGVSDSDIGWTFTVASALSIVPVMVLVRRADSVRRMRVGALAGAAIACGMAMLAVSVAALPIVAATIGTLMIGSLIFAIAYPLAAIGADRARIPHGVTMGALNSTWALGAILSPAIAGVVVDLAGMAPVYAGFSLIAVAFAGWMYSVDRRRIEGTTPGTVAG